MDINNRNTLRAVDFPAGSSFPKNHPKRVQLSQLIEQHAPEYARGPKREGFYSQGRFVRCKVDIITATLSELMPPGEEGRYMVKEGGAWVVKPAFDARTMISSRFTTVLRGWGPDNLPPLAPEQAGPHGAEDRDNAPPVAAAFVNVNHQRNEDPQIGHDVAVERGVLVGEAPEELSLGSSQFSSIFSKSQTSSTIIREIACRRDDTEHNQVISDADINVLPRSNPRSRIEAVSDIEGTFEPNSGATSSSDDMDMSVVFWAEDDIAGSRTFDMLFSEVGVNPLMDMTLEELDYGSTSLLMMSPSTMSLMETYDASIQSAGLLGGDTRLNVLPISRSSSTTSLSEYSEYAEIDGSSGGTGDGPGGGGGGGDGGGEGGGEGGGSGGGRGNRGRKDSKHSQRESGCGSRGSGRGAGDREGDEGGGGVGVCGSRSRPVSKESSFFMLVYTNLEATQISNYELFPSAEAA